MGQPATNDLVINTPKTWWGELDWANAAARIYMNNALEGTNASFQTAGSTSNTTSTFCRIGSSATSGFADMNFYGGVARASFWSSTDRTTITRYLGQLSGVTIS